VPWQRLQPWQLGCSGGGRGEWGDWAAGRQVPQPARIDMRLLLALFTGIALLTTPTLTVYGQDPASFVVRADLVVLHVSVQDSRGRWVPGLPESAFRVFEDGAVQPISHFGTHDAPVTVGLLIDNSISMRENRNLVIAAATEFAAAGHPDDELFALAFNERVVPVFPESAPFAESPAALKQALTAAFPRAASPPSSMRYMRDSSTPAAGDTPARRLS